MPKCEGVQAEHSGITGLFGVINAMFVWQTSHKHSDIHKRAFSLDFPGLATMEPWRGHKHVFI